MLNEDPLVGDMFVHTRYFSSLSRNQTTIAAGMYEFTLKLNSGFYIPKLYDNIMKQTIGGTPDNFDKGFLSMCLNMNTLVYLHFASIKIWLPGIEPVSSSLAVRHLTR